MLVTLWDYRVKNEMRTSDLELSTKGLVVITFIPNKIISFITSILKSLVVPAI